MRNGKYVIILLVLFLVGCSNAALPTSTPTSQSIMQTANRCDYISEQQPQNPAFKGMELYGWQNGEDGNWVFSILYGTNRAKMVGEVKSYSMDLEEVKQCFCDMPTDEHVTWLLSAQGDASGETERFPLPPENIVADLKHYANLCEIDFSTYWIDENRP